VQHILSRSELLVNLAAAAAALYGGLSDLYIGQVFGTWLDYVGAFAWGLGTKALIEGVYALVKWAVEPRR
jgi:hypothetical protein